MGADYTEYSPGKFALNVFIKGGGGGGVSTLQNSANGIVPVASSWDVDPTNLANATDGDIDTATGIGNSVNKGAFNDYGVLSIDLGSIKNVLIGGKVGIVAAAGTAEVYVRASTDGINFYQTNSLLINYDNVELIGFLFSTNVVAQYIDFVLTSNDNTTVSMRVFELMAYDLGTL